MANFGSLNPNFDVRAFLGDALSDLGTGLTSGNDLGKALGVATQQGQELAPARAAAAVQKQQAAETKAKTNQTRQFLSMKAPDLVPAFDMDPTSAMAAYIKRTSPQDPFTLGAGEVRYGPGGQVIARGPDRAADSGNVPAAIQEYQYALGQGFNGTFAEYQTQMKRAGATSMTFNGEQANAATFADRMKAAEPILESTEDVQGDLGQSLKSQVPLAGNFLTSPDYQKAQQAQRDFVNAVLRKESGAAISESEFNNAKQQYFPQPGDSPQVREQKRQNRAIAIAGMERSGGPAYGNPDAMQGPQTAGQTLTYNPETGDLE